MQNQKNNSNLPLAIIGLVLLAAIVGGWWLYSSSKAQTPKSNTNSSANAAERNAAREQAEQELYAKASPGAQPANMLGSPNAAVTIEEFADYQCPTCGLEYPKMKEINALYGNRIKFIYRNFPLQMHRYGYDAAVAAEAAGLQGKLWQMQDQLFTNRQAWENSPDARKVFEDYAQKIGLDVAKFQSDELGMAAKTRVDEDLKRGRALNVTGTPTVFINGKQLAFEQMEVSQMRQIIDAELQKANNQTQSNQPANQTTDNTNQAASNSNAAKDDSNKSK
ncbi:MAG: DsbA family protein [Pyrinomonadaceae bacterium]